MTRPGGGRRCGEPRADGVGVWSSSSWRRWPWRRAARSGTVKPVSVAPPSVVPKGAEIVHPSPPSADDTSCDPTASLAPPAAMPTPGQMPAGSFMAQIQARGYLNVGVDQNTYLWGYRDPATGQLTGFDIDMLDQVAEAIFGPSYPDHIHYTIVPNADRVQEVQQGKVDIVAETMTINCAREKDVDFSTVYYEAGQEILVPNNSTITGPQDLGGKRVCAANGSTSLQNLVAPDMPKHIQLWGVNNKTDCLVMLQQGQVDAISTDDAILLGLGRPGSERQGPRADIQQRALRHGHQQGPPRLHLLRERRPGRGASGRDVGTDLRHLPHAVHQDAGVSAPGELPVSAMAKITVEGIDERIGQFRAVLDRTTANLVALDADMTRQLLESSTSLRGATAERWADASGRHAELWRGQFALENALTQIAHVRGTRRSLPQTALARLDGLLGAACVQLPRSTRWRPAPPDRRPRADAGPHDCGRPGRDVEGLRRRRPGRGGGRRRLGRAVGATAPGRRRQWGSSRGGWVSTAFGSRTSSSRWRVPSRRPKRWLGTTRWRWTSLPCPGCGPGWRVWRSRWTACSGAARNGCRTWPPPRVVSVPAWRPSIPAARSSSDVPRRSSCRGDTWSALERLAQEFDLMQRDVEAGPAAGCRWAVHCAGRARREPAARGAAAHRGRARRAGEARRAARRAHRVPGQGTGHRSGREPRAGGALCGGARCPVLGAM